MRRSVLVCAPLAIALLAAIGTLLALDIRPAQGQATLPGFTHSQVISGLSGPTDMAFTPDGRLFVAEEAGKLRIATPDGELATILDISSKVDVAHGRGLIGIAFDPNFATNHFVYLHYTRKATATTPAHNRVVRVTAGGDSVVAGSEKLLFRLNNQSTPTHHGGAIDFGKDGKLYVSTGDNGIPDNAQKLTNLFGKMLRINKDGTIPSDNPFSKNPRVVGKNKAIWALGFRNPFKFAVKPGTSTIFINDVGETTWEEINRGAPGANYGWPVYEGHESDAKYTPPIYAYKHGTSKTPGCSSGASITGGAFYNPARVQFPSGYVGDYFFADFCIGWIRTYDPATDTSKGFATGLGSGIVDLEVSQDGTLYYLSRGSPGVVGKGVVATIRYTDS